MDEKACLFCRYFDGPFHCTLHDISTETDSSCGSFKEENEDDGVRQYHNSL